MTAKEYLSQARDLDKLINANIRELDYWHDFSGRISGSCFEPRYNPNRNIEPSFVRCLGKIEELKEEINNKIDKLVDLKREIGTAIEKLESTKEQLVLKLRYFDCMTWTNICNVMNVSERTARRIHDSALKNFEVPKS